MRGKDIGWVGALLVTGVMLGGAAAPVRAQGSFGISAGQYQPDDHVLDRTEVYGLRGGYRFRPDFGFEASLSRVDLVDGLPGAQSFPGFQADLQADLYNLDLSLQWLPRGGLVIFGGPGVARLDTKLRATFQGQKISESDTSNILTAHIGVAYEWQLSDRFFFRPEARVRRYFDDEEEASAGDNLTVSYEATDYEASVIFGWRFGS
jgi:Outer membrane protein beta-barrel domain